MVAPRLLPRPRHLEIGGAGCAADAPCTPRADASQPAEGFILQISPAGVELSHADANGRRYGEATLAQLRGQFPGSLPGLRIRDWPDFAVRGYMLDISRDRVPTRECLELLVGRLALLRINHLQLYTEHTFAYRDHEVVWRNASPITPDDVRWLDSLCREVGIELAANQNGFGHMGRWLAHDAYRDRAEAPEGWETPFGGRMEAGVLAPTKENADFVVSLMRELQECFTSRRINVNCDETFELGQGRSRGDVEARGRGAVYVEFLKRLLDALHADGSETLFWGDVVRQHPECLAELDASDTIGLPWHYEAPLESEPQLPPALLEKLAVFGMDGESIRGFDAHARPFEAASFPFWVCPGTSTWNTLVGRLANARGNLLDAANVGRARGASGYLITDWGDNGHMAPPSVSLAPLAYGASVAWCGDANRDLDLAPLLDSFIFEDTSGELGQALSDVGDAYRWCGQNAVNGSALQYAILPPTLLSAMGGRSADAAALAETVARLDDASARVGRAQPRCPDGDIVRRELACAIALARHGARRIAWRAGLPGPSASELRDELRAGIEEQSACWLLRSRPGGLQDSLDRLRWGLAELGGES